MDYSQPAFNQSYTCPLIFHCSSDFPFDRHDQLYHCNICMSEPWNNKGLTGDLKYINLPLEYSKKFTTVLYCRGILFFSYVEVKDQVSEHNFFVYYIHAASFDRFPSRPAMANESRLAFGFGFHPGTNEYKVVRIVEQEQPTGLEQQIEVFTLGKPMWMINRKNPFLLQVQPYAASFNGALHWLGQDKQNGSTIIVSFDLESENFQQIPTPDNCKSRLDRKDWRVVLLGGCLCIVDYNDHKRADIWSMKIYGVKESWIKEYTVMPFERLIGPSRPLCVLPNRNILIELQYLPESLYAYSVDLMTIYKIRIRDLPPRHSCRVVSVVDDAL
ncbi:hypothetical protein RGQ29_018132 [Quercus rubra]|uniref:F-box associated beta-propeller type 3 domain-containing protein n=1 Tax=Quercus rubra TaxID=3512 RepID=A0AAN7J1J3_QUERU|nr:hypothetical protein RGQ29_018132 [Quercus rubra]